MKATIPLICLALSAAGSALAQPVEVGPKVQLQTETGPVTVVSVQPPLLNGSEYDVTIADLDENGDNRLSPAEVPDDHALHFEWHIADYDGNGYITAEELARWKN